MATLNNNESAVADAGKQYLINQIIAIRDNNLANIKLFEKSADYFYKEYKTAYETFSGTLQSDSAEIGDRGIGAIATLVLSFAPGILSTGLSTFAKNNIFLKSKVFQTKKYEYGFNDISHGAIGIVFKPKYSNVKVELAGNLVDQISTTLTEMGVNSLSSTSKSDTAQVKFIESVEKPLVAAQKYRDQVIDAMRSTWNGSAQFINHVNNSGTLSETLIDSYYRELGRIIPDDRRLNIEVEKRDFKKYLHGKVLMPLKEKIDNNIFVTHEPINIKYLGILMEQEMWAHYILEQKLNPNPFERAFDLKVESRFQSKDRRGWGQDRHFTAGRMSGTYEAYGRHMLRRLLNFGVSQHASEMDIIKDRHRGKVNSEAELRRYETWAQFTMDFRGPQFWGEKGLKPIDLSSFWQEPQ